MTLLPELFNGVEPTSGWPRGVGRQYRHGTTSAYNAAPCEHCRHAYALYRAGRRAAGKDDPRKPRIPDDDDHISRQWFRRMIWKPALKAAHLRVSPRAHDLRHSRPRLDHHHTEISPHPGSQEKEKKQKGKIKQEAEEVG